MKMNKKGFTLIEMLVVIAIIAVLVAIIIPTVTAATTKAAAATNAANLRSIQAEAAIDKLGGVDETTGFVSYNATSGAFTVNNTAPAPKACGNIYTPAQTPVIAVTEVDGQVKATYDGHDVDYFAYIAEHGAAKA